MLLRCDRRGQIHARPHVFCRLQLRDSSHSTDSPLSQSHRPNMNFKPILACVFLGPIFTLIGIACLNGAMTEWKFGNESLDWPTVSGTIESSTVKRTKELDSTDYPAIRYRYTVNNQPYTSDRIQFDPVMGGAKEIVKSYPTGKDVNVYYQPDDHSQAVLQPGVHNGFIVTFAAATAFGLFGLGCLGYLAMRLFSLGMSLAKSKSTTNHAASA